MGRSTSCYIAGPMANQPDHGFPVFEAAAERLRLEGWAVMSPTMDVPPEVLQMGIDMGWAFRTTREYRDLMKRDLEWVIAVDTLFLLPGWENSQGARTEALVAQTVGKTIFSYAEEPRDRLLLRPELVVVRTETLEQAERVLAMPLPSGNPADRA